jgi:hypothetical protein
MPIIKESYGRHESVSIVTFGIGDIYMTKAKEPDHEHENLLCFSEIPGYNVGDESDLYKGESLDQLPNLSVVFRFENPESITALIHSLVELQQSVFKNKTQTT